MTDELPILLLDVMSTIVYDPFAREMPAFFGMTLDELLEAKHPTAWLDFERDEITEQTFFEQFFPDEGPDFDPAEFKAHVRQAYAFNPGMEQLLADLHDAGVEMHALSNYPSWWKMIEEELVLSRFLDWSFVSCKTGYRKPEAEAYLHAVRELGAEPWDCMFVDDRPINCTAAVAMGLEVVEFESADQLREELPKGWPALRSAL